MRHIIATATAALALASTVYAQESVIQVELQPGGQHVITLTGPFDSVSVGNPEVVDVLPKSDRVMVMAGKKAGSADVIAFRDAKPVFKATVFVSEGRSTAKVYSHTKKGVENYIAYECNPVCQRIKDEFALAPAQPIVVEGGGNSTINVIMPPQGGAAAPAR